MKYEAYNNQLGLSHANSIRLCCQKNMKSCYPEKYFLSMKRLGRQKKGQLVMPWFFLEVLCSLYPAFDLYMRSNDINSWQETCFLMRSLRVSLPKPPYSTYSTLWPHVLWPTYEWKGRFTSWLRTSPVDICNFSQVQKANLRMNSDKRKHFPWFGWKYRKYVRVWHFFLT